MVNTIRSLEEMDAFAAEFVRTLLEAQKLRSSEACIIGLCGDLGSGKTAFMKSLAKALGVQDEITSPTFPIVKSYKLQAPSFKLFHIDAYRIESSDELKSLRWQETIAHPKNIVFIEWPEKIADILPKNIQTLHFKFIDETTREISF